jgi:hypothetical protein
MKSRQGTDNVAQAETAPGTMAIAQARNTKIDAIKKRPKEQP